MKAMMHYESDRNYAVVPLKEILASVLIVEIAGLASFRAEYCLLHHLALSVAALGLCLLDWTYPSSVLQCLSVKRVNLPLLSHCRIGQELLCKLEWLASV